MAFKFSLAGLLRLREANERAELQRLQAAAARVAEARAAIEWLDATVEENRRQTQQHSASGVFGAELQFQASLEAVYRERRAALLLELAKLEQALQKQKEIYTRARQKREIVSNLRERRLSSYRSEQSRREQQQTDELFLLRSSRQSP